MFSLSSAISIFLSICLARHNTNSVTAGKIVALISAFVKVEVIPSENQADGQKVLPSHRAYQAVFTRFKRLSGANTVMGMTGVRSE
jgi:hypothetical protein